jgi:hypothetical protein
MEINLQIAKFNPTIASYSASDVKIYNATSSLMRFENKNNSIWKNDLACWRCM